MHQLSSHNLSRFLRSALCLKTSPKMIQSIGSACVQSDVASQMGILDSVWEGKMVNVHETLRCADQFLLSYVRSYRVLRCC